VVGGVRVASPCPLDLPEAGFHDLDLEVRLALEGEASLPWPHLEQAHARAVAPLGFLGWDPPTRAVWVRSVVPFSAALRGRLTLHASGVALQGRAVAFVGESGAGKSTLALAFQQGGCEILADDLLPVRFAEGGGPFIPDLRGEALPLACLLFPEREQGLAAPRAEALEPARVLEGLLRHGFGELREPSIWRDQFEAYTRISSRVPGFRLRMPEGLPRLPEAVACVRSALSGEAP
jgi:hypothetical protein